MALWGSGIALPMAVAVGALCGLAGAAVEAVSSHGLDNLTVQLPSAGVAYLLLA